MAAPTNITPFLDRDNFNYTPTSADTILVCVGWRASTMPVLNVTDTVTEAPVAVVLDQWVPATNSTLYNMTAIFRVQNTGTNMLLFQFSGGVSFGNGAYVVMQVADIDPVTPVNQAINSPNVSGGTGPFTIAGTTTSTTSDNKFILSAVTLALNNSASVVGAVLANSGIYDGQLTLACAYQEQTTVGAFSHAYTSTSSSVRSPLVAVAYNIAAPVPTNSITLYELAASYRVFQRPPTGSLYSITITGTTTGDPTGGIQWRLVNNLDGTSIAGYDWSTLIASPTVGAFSQSVNVPVNTSLIKYNIQVRFTADTGVTDTLANPFSVGVNYLQYGQSNGLRRDTRTTGTLTPSEFSGYFNGTNWSGFSTGDGAISTVNELIAELGIPVGYQNYSVDSQSIAALTSGTHWNNLVDGVNASGGDVEIVGIDQGERDGQLGTSAAAYQSTHQTLLDNLMTLTSRDASQLTMIVNYGGNSNGYAGGYTSATIAEVRLGKAAFVAANTNAIWGGHRLDLPLADTIHNTAAGYAIASAREIQSYLYYKGLVSQPADGKVISGVVVSGSDVIVSYSGAGSDLVKTGSGASTITQISEDDFSSLATITATTVAAGSVTHTLSAPPSGTVKVRDWYGADIPFTTYQGLVFPSNGESSIAYTGDVNIASTMSAMVSSVSLENTLPEYNIGVTSTLGNITSSVALTNGIPEYSISVSSTLSAMTSSVALVNELPEYTLGIASSLGAIQTTMSLVNGLPTSNVSIGSVLSGVTSEMSLQNIVPEYSLSVLSALGSIQTVMGLSVEDNTRSLSISSTLSAVTSAVGIANQIPEINLSVSSTFNPIVTSMSLVVGELTYSISPKNIIYINTTSRIINIR